MTNYIKYVLIRHIREYEQEHGEIGTSELEHDE